MNSAASMPPAVVVHVKALREIALRLDAEPRQLDINGKPTTPLGGWLCRAVAEHAEAKYRSTSSLVADLVTSDLPAPAMLAELWAHFHNASRRDVFQGVVMAAALWRADIALAELAAAGAVMERAA